MFQVNPQEQITCANTDWASPTRQVLRSTTVRDLLASISACGLDAQNYRPALLTTINAFKSL